jgi:hypothetical protein
VTPGQVADSGIQAGRDRDQRWIGNSLRGQGRRSRRRGLLRGRSAAAERGERQGRRQAGAAPSVDEPADLVLFPVSTLFEPGLRA